MFWALGDQFRCWCFRIPLAPRDKQIFECFLRRVQAQCRSYERPVYWAIRSGVGFLETLQPWETMTSANVLGGVRKPSAEITNVLGAGRPVPEPTAPNLNTETFNVPRDAKQLADRVAGFLLF